MRFLIVGVGALGTVYGCLLKEKGHAVSGLDREPAVTAIRRDGLHVSGIWGEHAAFTDRIAQNAAELTDEHYDAVILTVKSFDTETAVRQIQGLLKPDTLLILAQNGYGNYQTAAKYIPAEQLVLGRVIFGSETLDYGSAKVTVIADDVILGSPAQVIEEVRLQTLADIFNTAGVPTRVSERVMDYLWGKIMYNSALNSMGAILEASYGELAEGIHSRNMMNAIIREIFAVITASGQRTLWDDPDSYLNDFYTKMIPPTAKHHASMLQDIQRGRRTEIDALNGAVAILGREYGVPTPVNEVVAQLVRAKEERSMKVHGG